MFAGRALRFYRGNELLAGATTDGFTITREPINVTDKDDAGVQRLIAANGTYGIEGTVGGILRNRQMIDDFQDATPANPVLTEFDLQVADQGIYRGRFYVTSFELTGAEGAEATTFSMSLASANEVIFSNIYFTGISTVEFIGSGENQFLRVNLMLTNSATVNALNALNASFNPSTSFTRTSSNGSFGGGPSLFIDINREGPPGENSYSDYTGTVTISVRSSPVPSSSSGVRLIDNLPRLDIRRVRIANGAIQT